jgi:hypothetical protein
MTLSPGRSVGYVPSLLQYRNAVERRLLAYAAPDVFFIVHSFVFLNITGVTTKLHGRGGLGNHPVTIG